ncbi:MAG: thioredoxin domain-containing protein [Streptosporangiales bacterium]|nr:thioredoxin domain-containing protein [Streptosporangiales bacterium]
MASRKEQKAAARERLRQEMEKRKRRSRRNRIIGVTAGVLVLVLGAVTIGIVVQNQREQDARADRAVPAGVIDDVAIPVGEKDAPVTLKVYEDFRCPACKQFEEAYNTTITKLVEQGKLRVEYHVATIIDANVPNTSGSKVAGNAAACAQDAGKFRQFHDVLFKNQPPEDQDLFTNDQMMTLAKDVDGLADDSNFERCVQDQQYVNWLKKVQSEFDTRFQGRVATPSLVLDDEVMMGGQQQGIAPPMASPEAFEKTVNDRASGGNGKKPSSDATPSGEGEEGSGSPSGAATSSGKS